MLQSEQHVVSVEREATTIATLESETPKHKRNLNRGISKHHKTKRNRIKKGSAETDRRHRHCTAAKIDRSCKIHQKMKISVGRVVTLKTHYSGSGNEATQYVLFHKNSR